MKKIVLFSFVYLFTATLYSQIGFQNHEVTSFTEGSEHSLTGDIDNDGYADIVSFGGGVQSHIKWYKNKYPETGFRQKQAIEAQNQFINSIDLSDFDGDGDLDILVANGETDTLYWHENLDGLGNFGPLRLLKTIDKVRFVKHIDMDNDGDKDLLYIKGFGTEGDFNQIAYYENTNQPINYNTLHLVNSEDVQSTSASFQDLDQDGDVDVFLRFDASLRWIKNNGGHSFSPTIVIVEQPSQSNISYYRICDINDIDNDGDKDVVGYIQFGSNNKLSSFLNDGQGNFGAEQIIRQNLAGVTNFKLADINNDALRDVIVANQNTDLLWYKNEGASNFTVQPTIRTAIGRPDMIDTFDMDNDGDKDLITVTATDRVSTYRNNGLGVFAMPEYPAAQATDTKGALAVDIDIDGDLDVLAIGAGRILLYKKLNTGNEYSNQLFLRENIADFKKLAVADLDGDTDLDIITISGSSGSPSEDKVSWFKNLDGVGTFGPSNDMPYGSGGTPSPDGLTVYDVDGDGDKDIVTAISNWPGTGDRIVWFANNGSGSFGSAQTIGTGVNQVMVILQADVDNDGDLDLLSGSSTDNKVAWFENLNGQGSFGPQRIITTAALGVNDLAIADFDSDGFKDVVYMSNYTDDAIRWQKNLDGLGNFGPPQIIDSYVGDYGSYTISVADIDNDADNDIIVGEAMKMVWFENLHGQANFEPAKIISTNPMSIGNSQVVDMDLDGDLDILVATGSLDRILWHENTGLTQNTIKGEVRLDLAGNGCDAADRLVPNMLISTTNGTSTLATMTFRNEFSGKYRLYTGEGNFQTSVIAQLPAHYRLTPLSHNASFTGFGNIATANFCIEPVGQINDLYVALYPLGDARPGFDTSYQLVYKNVGTTTLTGQTALEYNNAKIQFLNGSTVPSSQSPNTLNFAFTDLAPFEVRSVILNFHVFAPPTTTISDSLLFTATTTPVASDLTPNDNTVVFRQQVIGSYDPNDITCLEGDQVLFSDADKYLHYTIRFQNTGTASAINVKVLHQLDEKLDWTTFQLEGMSHSGRVTIQDGNLAEFMYNNIRLPHSSANEANSHGFINFKIKPKTNVVAVGDIVHATANIYFDFNPPVTTNTAATQYVNLLGTESFNAESFALYPNPAKDQLTINAKEEILKIEVHTILGSKVLEEKNANVINVANLKSGVYLISITTEKGNCTRKFIKE